MDLDTLEKELRALRPAAPSEKLALNVGEITGALPEASVVFFPEAASLRRRVRRWQAGAAMAGAMAACLAIVLMTNGNTEGSSPVAAEPVVAAVSPALSPVEAEKPRLKDPIKVSPPAGSLVMMGREGRLQSAQSEGWLDQQDGTRARLVRLRYLDSVRWRDPSDAGAVIETTLPREEIVSMPSDETY